MSTSHPVLLVGLCNKPFFTPNSNFSLCLASLCMGHRNLPSVTGWAPTTWVCPCLQVLKEDIAQGWCGAHWPGGQAQNTLRQRASHVSGVGELGSWGSPRVSWHRGGVRPPGLCGVVWVPASRVTPRGSGLRALGGGAPVDKVGLDPWSCGAVAGLVRPSAGPRGGRRGHGPRGGSRTCRPRSGDQALRATGP